MKLEFLCFAKLSAFISELCYYFTGHTDCQVYPECSFTIETLPGQVHKRHNPAITSLLTIFPFQVLYCHENRLFTVYISVCRMNWGHDRQSIYRQHTVSSWINIHVPTRPRTVSLCYAKFLSKPTFTCNTALSVCLQQTQRRYINLSQSEEQQPEERLQRDPTNYSPAMERQVPFPVGGPPWGLILVKNMHTSKQWESVVWFYTHIIFINF